MTYTVQYLDEIDSTNTYCKKLAREGAPGGTVIIAAHQTGGRGRLGRRFCSPRGTGLYASVLLRPEWDTETLQLVTACAAAAAARAVDSLCGVHTQIKWVNDLFLGGRKLCGILTEAGFTPAGGIDYVVVGIGINLRDTRGAFPEELHAIVTSIEEETGCILTPEQMAKALLCELDKALSALPDRGFLEEYRERSVLLGKDVTVQAGGAVYIARAVEIDDRAGLVVERPDGSRQTLTSGEVSVRL
ncbi:MAG: biotin--[Ruminococcus sp.]|nr:biotin--[acetyl-CoA-carboxylase] ligase [Ruminococcus sp.]